MNPDQLTGIDDSRRKPEPPTVVGAVSELGDLLESLGESISRLEDRLQPVLAESNASTSAVNPSEASGDCETVRRIHQLQSRTQALRDYVSTITDLARV